MIDKIRRTVGCRTVEVDPYISDAGQIAYYMAKAHDLQDQVNTLKQEKESLQAALEMRDALDSVEHGKFYTLQAGETLSLRGREQWEITANGYCSFSVAVRA